MGDEHRTAPRRRVLKAGSISFGGGVIDCTIRNISETGACLEVYDPVLQNLFDLVFDLNQARRACRVVWRKHPRMGVEFQN